MLHWLDWALAAPDSPTADLYLANALGAAPGLGRVAPTVFAGPAGTAVLRHAGRAGGWPAGPLVYLTDDDIPAGLEDASLPRRYRRKLALLEAPCWQRMRRAADVWVVASDVLAERAAREGRRALRLDPFWSERFAPLDHHDAGGPVDIAFLGSSVHRADLAMIAPAIAAALAAEPRARFHLSERHVLPGPLAGHPQVRRIPGRGWGAYRRGLGGRRFHIALYPLLETAFNRARSVNKLIEHGVVGAAPVYSAWWPAAAPVANGVDGLLCGQAAAGWRDALLALIADPGGRRRLAEGAQRLARRLNSAAAQRLLWSRALGVTA